MPLTIGPYVVDPPVVLAPMAGVTNAAFRGLCREYAASGLPEAAPASESAQAAQAQAQTRAPLPVPTAGAQVARGLYVCEMVTTRALLIRSEKTLRMVEFWPQEQPRSLQLYGVDPVVVGRAVRMVVDENLADHIDLNFGCPVPKVTRRGGGSALPWRRKLFAKVVRAAVDAATPAGIPVTVKMRKGIDDDHLTYRHSGLLAQEAGCAAVALHARTTAQGYSGAADWAAIADLKQLLDIPVLGNGDIWEAGDALRMMAQTGADGVVVGRGCLGRPWLFQDLAAAFSGATSRALPSLGEVAATMLRHAGHLIECVGDEPHGCADFRKHVAWYLKGFPVGGPLRRQLAMVSSLAELSDLLGELDPGIPFPEPQLGVARGRTSSSGRVILPEGWLEDPDGEDVPFGAESGTESGG